MTRRLLPVLLLLFAAAAIAAQDNSAPAQSSTVTEVPHTADLGFTYSIPSDWEVVDAHPMLPAVKQEQSQSASTEEEKKGIECVQVSLTARHGTPPSVIVIVELPYGCFGQTMTKSDLPGFAQGASEGLKKSFDISDPIYGAYQLGSHNFWIERAKGTVIDHPEAVYEVEIACTLLKKGAACWMAMASDATALQTFETGKVALDGEAALPLVPARAFDQKPGQ
jgi:hypothetical protein